MRRPRSPEGAVLGNRPGEPHPAQQDVRRLSHVAVRVHTCSYNYNYEHTQHVYIIYIYIYMYMHTF